MKHTAKQLKEMTTGQLQELLQKLRGEERQMRFLASHGELREVHKIKATKRTIARILSILKTKALTEKANQG